MKILVDPILVGNLNFGIPLLYEASKKYTKNFQVRYLVALNYRLWMQIDGYGCDLIFG